MASNIRDAEVLQLKPILGFVGHSAGNHFR
jgi:hypothetical protein